MSENGTPKVSEKELVKEIMRQMEDGRPRSVAQVVESTKEDNRRVAIVLGRLGNFGLLEKSEKPCKSCGTVHVVYGLPK